MSKYGVFSVSYFPVFGLNTGKYGPEQTPYLDTFHAVITPCHYWATKRQAALFNNYFTIIGFKKFKSFFSRTAFHETILVKKKKLMTT